MSPKWGFWRATWMPITMVKYSKSPRPGVVGPIPNGHEHGGYKWRWPSPNYLHPPGADPPSRIQYFRWSQALRAQWYDIYKAGKPHSFFSHNKRRHSTKIRGQSGTLKEKTPEQRERVAGRGGCFLWSMSWLVGGKFNLIPTACVDVFFCRVPQKKLFWGTISTALTKKTPWNKTKKAAFFQWTSSQFQRILWRKFSGLTPFSPPQTPTKMQKTWAPIFPR